MLRHAVSKCIAGNLEESACFGNVAPCALQCFLQQLFFHFLNREAEGQKRCFLESSIRSSRSDVSQRGREMLGLYQLILTRDRESFDHIVQLSYIAGPVVVLQECQCGWS